MATINHPQNKQNYNPHDKYIEKIKTLIYNNGHATMATVIYNNATIKKMLAQSIN